ncbi:hypothetical protein [Cryobacterium sp. Y11]|uniref:hypothetical protein n=1 Tax=Cryobacterium sp. Y11 TaxID=2045016 RepID=UPI000CE327F9|nr:hypothetical protein [Cryobacterium sp. Y11]
MLEQIRTHHNAAAPVDVEWKIRHLTRSIRTRERMLTWGGFATPHAPEAPQVLAERTAAQLAGIADLRVQLAHWEAIQANQTTITNATRSN